MLLRRIILRNRVCFGSAPHSDGSDGGHGHHVPKRTFKQNWQEVFIGRGLGGTSHQGSYFKGKEDEHHAGHGHDHVHPDYRVHIARDKPWIKLRGPAPFVSIQGVEEVNAQMLNRGTVYPWDHIQNSSPLSYQSLYINEPWTHHPKGDPGFSDPERGYAIISDPFDTRYFILEEHSTINYIIYCSIIAFFVVNGIQTSSDKYSTQNKARQICKNMCLAKRELLDKEDTQIQQLERRNAELRARLQN